VKVLFDMNTPAPLALSLERHQVIRAGEVGWQSFENGALLDAAEQAGFDVLVTCDQNIRYQQNFEGRHLAVVVLSTNHWPSLKPVAGRIATAIDFAKHGQIVRVEIPVL
jgi:hypothetical protein